jgi:hypothetical protein
MLLWTSLRLPHLNSLLEIFYGTSGITLQTLQTRQAAVCIQVLLEVEHPLIGFLGLAIFPYFQMSVAEDAIGVSVGRIEFDRLGGLLGCACEVVSGVEDKGQVTPCLTVLGTDLQRLPQCLLRQVKVGDVAALPGLLAVGIS